jgi:predicted alpha-1,2-mannosidase/cyclically-permuted mutarotase family protein
MKISKSIALCLMAVLVYPVVAKVGHVRSLPPVPVVEAGAESGLSSAVSIQTGSVVYVAGGYNYPEKNAHENGKKRFYSQILGWSGKEWWTAGRLRQPIASGVAIEMPGGFVYIGGENARGAQHAVDLYRFEPGSLPVIESLPSLPVAMHDMAGIKVGQRIYIAGGLANGQASNALLMLDLSLLDEGWQSLPDFPGPPRVRPVITAALKDGIVSLYLWGGYAIGDVASMSSVSIDGLRYEIGRGLWSSLLPPVDSKGELVYLGGAAAARWNDTLTVFTGGYNSSVFLRSIERDAFFKGVERVSLRRNYFSRDPQWHRFNTKLMMFDSANDRWMELLSSPQLARTGAAAVRIQDKLLVFQGEMKPGESSQESFLVQLPEKAQATDMLDFVNPFIGTGGHGHTFPGPTLPNGMIQPSPDTRMLGWDACSGYHYTDSMINGFSHTHLSGTGIGDYGDFLIMPTVGAKDMEFEGTAAQNVSYASGFSHRHECASPGYYSVWLDRYDVFAELTTTSRAALHRYTFPKTDSAGFVLDIDYTLQKHINTLMEVEVVNDSTIRGRKNTQGWAWDQEIAFYAVFSKPFSWTMIDDTLQVQARRRTYPRKKVLLQFETEAYEQVLVKIGISHLDMMGAEQNLKTEIPDWDFERVHQQARQRWREYLSKIQVETPNREYKEIFYSALYHTAIAPNLFNDVDGRYKGMDKRPKSADEDVYTVFSLWDTFRALHPLLTIIDPDLNSKFIRSLLRKYDEGGILPMWELAANYTGTMIGYNAVPVIVDAYMKGDRSFDAEHALKACIRSAVYDTTGILSTRYVRDHGLMPLSKQYKNTLGYIPFDSEVESVAKGLEYAYNDWCIARMAEAMGNHEVQEKFDNLALNYRHYFDASTGFMRGKDAEGNWRTPFHPRASDHRNDDYCEGTAWQWTWFVPHDVNGLIRLMGGRKNFITKLDSLFLADSSLEGDVVSADITGLIGQYAHGNEPSHHIIHLYNRVGQPYKAQALVDSVLHSLYHADPDGLSGNEDCGQMSAWYVMNALGFYQIAPGDPTYSIGRPLFDKATIQLPGGKQFEIITKNNSRANKYIKEVRLNGKLLKDPFFTHQVLMNGGRLDIVMVDKPSRWGVKD